jgi:cytochrome c-type biogenesis protein CcmE
MKNIHIFGIVVIALAIGIIISTATDASTYVDFATAEKMAVDNNNTKIHVVGKLKKDVSGQILGMKYEPAIDANLFEFLLVDNKNIEKKVIYHEPKPQDFGKAEQVVIIGKMDGDIFKCDKILLKCPSKYQDGKVEFKEVKKVTARF